MERILMQVNCSSGEALFFQLCRYALALALALLGISNGFSQERAVLRGPRTARPCFAFSPDSKLVASAHDDSVILWNVGTGAEILSWVPGRDEPVQAIAFHADGKTIATATLKTIRVHDPNTGRLLSSQIVNSVKKWDVPAGKLRDAVDIAGGGLALAFDSTGKLLATRDIGSPREGSPDTAIRLWSVQSGKQLSELKGHQYPASLIVFCNDGKVTATASGKTIKLWEVSTGKELVAWNNLAGGVGGLAFSPDGKNLASASGWNILDPGAATSPLKLWDVAKRSELASLKTLETPYYCVQFSPDGRTLATGWRWTNDVQLWDVAARKQKTQLKGHSTSVKYLAFSPDGRTLVTAAQDGSIRLWNVPEDRANGDIP
jgi:WD40 repeat protein